MNFEDLQLQYSQQQLEFDDESNLIKGNEGRFSEDTDTTYTFLEPNNN